MQLKNLKVSFSHAYIAKFREKILQVDNVHVMKCCEFAADQFYLENPQTQTKFEQKVMIFMIINLQIFFCLDNFLRQIPRNIFCYVINLGIKEKSLHNVVVLLGILFEEIYFCYPMALWDTLLVRYITGEGTL